MRQFWPVYLTVAAISGVAVWTFAPLAREHIPENTRATMRAQLEAARKLINNGNTPAKSPSTSERSTSFPTAASTVDRARAAVASIPNADRALGESSSSAQDNSQSQATSQLAEKEDSIPSLLGVVQADPQHAPWGVVNTATTMHGLDGSEIGAAKGGELFIIERRQRKKSGLELIGNFYPSQMEEPVVIPAESVYCFTGAPDNLSKRQRTALSKYYRLRGDADTLRINLLKANAAKSPFAIPARDALRSFREKARDAEALETKLSESASTDQYKIQTRLAQLKNEISVLRGRVQKLSAQHKAWKQAHASELPDPEKDPRYIELIESRAAYADLIPGMAY